MKKQIVVIHGGDTFATNEEYISFLNDFVIDSLDYFKGSSWKDSLGQALGEPFEVIAPKMPNKFNAKYSEWKIWFEKLAPLLNQEVVFVGHSLGGIFLAKYLSEHTLNKTIQAVFLVSAPYDEKDTDESLADFSLPETLENFEKQVSKIYLYHSKDDPVVPFIDVEKYKKALPNAVLCVFEDRKHFNQEVFPELVEEIKSL
jgi:predicted alpha/beta hydrolase family esterase